MLRSSKNSLRSRWGVLFAFVFLALFIAAFHSYQFENYGYYQDEAWDVHSAVLDSVQQIVQDRAQTVHPPGWFIAANLWVKSFGHVRDLTRFLSTLFTVVTLALVFRLGCDLFDPWTALIGALLLGTAPFFQLWGHLFRPYSMLACAAIGSQWALLRWLRRPGFKYALLFVTFGILTVYSQYYGLFIMAAEAVFVLLFVRWNRGLYLRALGLFAAVGLSFTPWILPLLRGVQGGGVNYGVSNTPEGLASLYDQTQFAPSIMASFLMLAGLAIPAAKIFGGPTPSDAPIFRFGTEWRKWFVILIPATVLGLGLIGNAALPGTLVPRSLLGIAPSAALFAAFALQILPRRGQVIFLALMMPFALAPFPSNYLEYPRMAAVMAQDYRPGSPVIIDTRSQASHVMLTYYVSEEVAGQIPNEAMFQLTPLSDGSLRLTPQFPANYARGDDAASLERFHTFIGSAEAVWYVKGEGGVAFDQPYEDYLKAHYVALSQYGPGRNSVTEYRLLPDHLQTLFRFGEHVSLQNWSLRESVSIQPCQVVTLDSLWQADQTPGTNYSMTLVLADTNGRGIVRSDGSPSATLASQWQPGQLYMDERHLAIPCNLTSGQYLLLAGLYNYATQKSLPVTTGSGAPVHGLAYLTTLTIP